MKFRTLNKARVVNSIVTIVFCDSQRLSNLTRVNIGTCHLLGQSFGRRTANASILMKFCTLHKSRAVNSMMKIFFCNFWRLSILTPVTVGTCHLLGHSFGRRTASASTLMKFRTLHKSRVVNSIVTIVFYDFRHLSNLTRVNIGICHLLGHSFGPKTANLPILMKFRTLHKSRGLNSMVTIVFCDSWRLSILAIVNIGTCYLLGHSFWPKTANALVLMKFCTLHKTRVVNSMVSILRDSTGCCRELKLGLEKQTLCQKFYCYIINKTDKKLWPTSVKLFS